jgi:hypothetical protein
VEAGGLAVLVGELEVFHCRRRVGDAHALDGRCGFRRSLGPLRGLGRD